MAGITVESNLGRSRVQWSSVRLELAETAGFPEGSAARAYIVHLPLSDVGTIDASALLRAPTSALIRRYWPNEADLLGFVSASDRGWTFSCRIGPEDDERIFDMSANRIKRGEYLTIREHDGSELMFRVAEVHLEHAAHSSRDENVPRPRRP